MSHYQLSNFAIYGLEHSETDMNYQLSNFAIYGLEHSETDMNMDS